MLSPVRDVKRMNEIVAVLARYGLAPWLQGVKVDWIQNQFKARGGDQIAELSQGAQLREALTELGTTFIKLGQILSTRPDLVGPEISAELSHLQSSVPADPPETVREIVEGELGSAIEERFLEFNLDAAASASIGQVHFAKLQDGTDVVVKVQHPGIEATVRSDLDILHTLATLADKHSEAARQFRPVETIEEFSRTLLAELDFNQEKRSLEQFNSNFENDPTAVIPKPYGELSTHRVLTMDRLDGISLAKADRLVAQGHDLNQIAERGANIFLEMIFRDGFYHADPHPGNIFAVEDSKIGLLDFGMVGRIDEKLREQFEDLLIAAVDKDTLAVCDSICELGSVPKDMDADRLRVEIGEFLSEYGSQSLDNFDVGGALNRMMAIIRRFNIVLPSRVSLLIKVLVMLEGTARGLNPSFNLAQILQPWHSKIIKRRLSPQRLFHKAKRNAQDWTRLVEIAPRELTDILQQVNRGSFDVNLEHRKLDSITNRMVLGNLDRRLVRWLCFDTQFRDSAHIGWNVSPGRIGLYRCLLDGIAIGASDSEVG